MPEAAIGTQAIAVIGSFTSKLSVWLIWKFALVETESHFALKTTNFRSLANTISSPVGDTEISEFCNHESVPRW